MKLPLPFALIWLAAATAFAAPATGAEPTKPFVVVNEAMDVPVFPYDITDRPYVVVGEVTAGVRKATIFSQEASEKKLTPSSGSMRASSTPMPSSRRNMANRTSVR